MSPAFHSIIGKSRKLVLILLSFIDIVQLDTKEFEKKKKTYFLYHCDMNNHEVFIYDDNQRTE